MAINAKSLTIGIIIGIILSTAYVVWKSTQDAVVGEPTKEITKLVATPEIRTVYIYKDAKKPPGTTGDVLTAVKTETGTATALLDDTGHASIVLKTDPIAWLSTKGAHQVTYTYGYTDGEVVNRLGYRWDFLRVKRVHFGLLAENNIGSANKDRKLVGIDISYRW